MPEYDPTRPPSQVLPDLRPDTPLGEPGGRSWPDNPAIPEQYDGPTTDREFETSGGPLHAGRPVPAVQPPADAPAPEKSIAPPPGHTAQP